MSSYAYLAGPLTALGALGVIVLICRWVFNTDHRQVPASLVREADFGLLRVVAVVRTIDDAEMLRAVLRREGIRGTVTPTTSGFAVLVFAADVDRARELVLS